MKTGTMSQATLLEEVERWSPDACRQQLHAVLPDLVSMHQAADSGEEHARVLRIITGMFLPHLHPSELEEKCFSLVLPKVVDVFRGLTEEITGRAATLSSQNTELRLLLRNVLQDSEDVYGGRLSLVQDLLQALFKEAYGLQKGLMELLERVALEDTASEEDVSDIVTAIHSLLDMCAVVSGLDVALHANTWKFIIRQSVKHLSLVEEQLRHGDIVSGLCEELLGSLDSCVELGEQINQSGLQSPSPEHKLLQKSTKICRFFSNTLVHYAKEFKDFLAKSCSRFHQLYLQVHGKFPPCLSAASLPPALCEELGGAVLVAMDALLTQLLPSRPFAESVLADDQDLHDESALPQCLLLVSVVGKLPSQPEETLQLWCDGSQFPEETLRLSVFEAVFRSYRRCSVERAWPVQLPGVMLRGQAQSSVSLHRHVCAHLCGLVAALPPPQLPPLERSMLAAVLQPDTQTALLATDVWCFVARYGTAELCLHHVLLVAQLVRSCEDVSRRLNHPSLLLRRLLFLLTPAHQTKLVDQFPPSQEENAAVWGHLLLRSLSPDVRTRVERDLIAVASTVVTEWEINGFRLGDLERVNRALRAVRMLLKVGAPERACVSCTVGIVTRLWPRMCPGQIQVHAPVRRALVLLLSLSACVVKSLDPQLTCQALVCLDALLPLRGLDDVCLAGLDFLAALGSVFIPSDLQSQVLPRLSGVFRALLTSDPWPLQQHALEAFSIFAEVTSHEEVISQSLTSEDTKARVVNFLSKAAPGEEPAAARLERLKAECCVMEAHSHSLDKVAAPSSHARTTESEEEQPHNADEPRAKRARRGTSVWDEGERYLRTAERALRGLQTLPSPPPPRLLSRLKELQALITQIADVETGPDVASDLSRCDE
ncbi:FIGNL1-interacting regulator of recombination and mitosis isoform X2 [Denticeps clupeoides]|uniref:FIGNL1-interacting regulator of recombination and mitosis isoform X2 n=1 Tax=Denticeps clupeoides TaxID=299321 RepID=UPI0010A2D262|nr:uncharacterized protein C1orf112 homolog isoform X2 [Denticeps clupeoides]